MQFSVTVLGSNSALPTSERYPTAQILNVSERFFLIDCGEGTQMQLRKNKIRFSKINHIFISHLHGDHCFGLIGLISTLGLLGRKSDLTVFAHSDLEKVLKPQLTYFCADLPYRVIFNHINPHQNMVIFEDSKITVETIPLKHRIPTCGFLFREKQGDLHIVRESIDFYQIPLKAIPSIKKGADYVNDEGEVIANHLLTKPAAATRSYAFCSDTAYDERIIPIIQDVDLLYHEATFLDDNHKLALQTQHSTAREAATLALKARVKKLIIGHFSTRYYDLSAFENEARVIFDDTSLAREGDIFSIPNTTRG
ncbi:ribonuclease Z [Alkaliflexus imshenetskii]|uniref:ribonuclease Z n=1 Tax=Alkaliflexus imshenetskii TaxID=286730 RepID=UPI000479B40B|nr:ribonuclease Z [Alkaliflexus imshenetskii]